MRGDAAPLYSLPLGSGKRRVRNGEATNDLILSASTDGNDRAFPCILDLM